ncbi:right-handed parallel beta-helix repeat-containing protein [Mobilicoccus pelagius]|uniref:right-handed parallel beta-helix repeat-containing protein n=1 Tax=Mobilicoccus pelagius TaxID=746032 RepID=UPI00068F14CC|nr:right-handed parallel beta-helix repeat-containing protein [Mobilicoccus pelagius]
MAVAHPGGTIVLASGVYHELVHIADTPNLTIRAEAGATVWMDGSVPIQEIKSEGSHWRLPDQAPDLDRSPTYTRGAPDNRKEGWRFVSPDYPLAADPSQVWLDGRPLRQVGARDGVGPGTFAVDGRDLLVGDDPDGHDVRIGTLTHALVVDAPGTRIEGIGIRRYVPSVPDFGAVVLGGRGDRLTSVAVVDSSTTGVSVQGENVTLENVTVQRSGMLGVQAHRAFGLRILGGHFSHNNTLGFNMAPNAGGIKITETAPLQIRDASIDRNLGVGLWLDESVGDATLYRLSARGNSLHGVLVELSSRVKLVGCRLTGNDGSGLRVQNSDQVDVWNITSLTNRRAVDYVQDGRTPGSSGAPRVSSDPRIPPMTWRIGRSTVANSILGASTGDAELAVEDFTRSLDADDLGMRLDTNVYRRAASPAARWTQVWTRPGQDPNVYTSVRDFSAAHHQDVHSVEQLHSKPMTYPVPQPIPQDVREAGQLPAGPQIGAF